MYTKSSAFWLISGTLHDLEPFWVQCTIKRTIRGSYQSLAKDEHVSEVRNMENLYDTTKRCFGFSVISFCNCYKHLPVSITIRFIFGIRTARKSAKAFENLERLYFTLRPTLQWPFWIAWNGKSRSKNVKWTMTGFSSTSIYIFCIALHYHSTKRLHGSRCYSFHFTEIFISCRLRLL